MLSRVPPSIIGSAHKNMDTKLTGPWSYGREGVNQGPHRKGTCYGQRHRRAQRRMTRSTEETHAVISKVALPCCARDAKLYGNMISKLSKLEDTEDNGQMSQTVNKKRGLLWPLSEMVRRFFTADGSKGSTLWPALRLLIPVSVYRCIDLMSTTRYKAIQFPGFLHICISLLPHSCARDAKLYGNMISKLSKLEDTEDNGQMSQTVNKKRGLLWPLSEMVRRFFTADGSKGFTLWPALRLLIPVIALVAVCVGYYMHSSVEEIDCTNCECLSLYRSDEYYTYLLAVWVEDLRAKYSRDEWRTGLKALRADSISKLKKAFPELVQEVSRPSNFQDFYIYAFRYCLTVLGLQFHPQVDKLNNYLMYQNDYKVITMDQWMGFIRLCNEIDFSVKWETTIYACKQNRK
ncbi:Defective in cullin neddylation protein [Zea mays]|uniref:Defective in cullin neddylation protein n=1 Tax=Zea mays TaxID=4577 RepID=A0A1D6MFV7_MAIZE|nr:Defective in cullin neddylation protein [Zea mays]